MKKINLFCTLFSGVAALGSLTAISSCACNKNDSTVKYIPTELLDIKGNELWGLKDNVDISSYNAIKVPNEIRYIKANAFKEIFVNTNVTKLVLHKDIRSIEAVEFDEQTSFTNIDITSWTDETIQYFEFCGPHFTNLSLYGMVEYDHNISASSLAKIKEIFIGYGIPESWFENSTEGHVTAVAKYYESANGTSSEPLVLSQPIDQNQFEIIGGAVRTNGTNGVNIKVNDCVVYPDNKTVRADVEMVSSKELVDGDYVTYNLTIICKNKTDGSIKWKQDLQEFKLVYKSNKQVEVSTETTILEDGKLELQLINEDANVQYSFDGINWINIGYSEEPTSVPVCKGNVVYFKGYNPNVTPDNRLFSFAGTKTKFVLRGKAMSLYNDAGKHSEVKMPECAFVQMFKDCTGLVSIDENYLDSNTLTTSCYYQMFKGCTNLINLPKLPALEIPFRAYEDMFQGCESLTDASITLPGTKLSENCYSGMFANCKNIINGPTIMATEIVDNAFNAMFLDCSKLENIKLMYAGELNDTSFFNWVSGVTSNGKLYYNGTTTEKGASSIPTNWTVEKF